MRDYLLTGTTKNESPPPDAIWTMDKILQKPPQAPARQRQESQEQRGDGFYSMPIFPRFNNYHHNDDVRNQDDLFNDDDDDEYDTEMMQVQRTILPSRKLFADDDDENMHAYDDDDDENNTREDAATSSSFRLPPRRLEEGHLDNSTFYQHRQPPSLLLLPTLLHSEDENRSRHKQYIGGEVTPGTTTHPQFSFGNNPIPVRMRFEPIVVEDEGTCSTNLEESVSSSSSQDYYCSIHSPRRDQIFRRMEDEADDDEYEQRNRNNLFRPLPSTNYNNTYNDSGSSLSCNNSYDNDFSNKHDSILLDADNVGK